MVPLTWPSKVYEPLQGSDSLDDGVKIIVKYDPEPDKESPLLAIAALVLFLYLASRPPKWWNTITD